MSRKVLIPEAAGLVGQNLAPRREQKNASETAASAKHANRTSRKWMAAGLSILLFPFALYSAIAIHTSVNIPYRDDYDSIGFLVEYFLRQDGLHAKLRVLLTSQHVQYKLIFLQIVSVLQYYIQRHTNYRVLQLIGDLFIPATVAMLWLFVARTRRPLAQRIWLFIVPCYLFFSVRYAETVNWAMSGIQNIGIIPISLLTLYVASSGYRRSTFWTGVLLAWAIATSGNGFFVSIIVLYLFVQAGRRWDALKMLGVTAAMAALYAVHYHVYMVYAPLSRAASIKSAILFPLAFLGNCARTPVQAVVLGACGLLLFVFLTWKGWLRQYPGTFSSALFCIVTAFGVAATRYRAGYEGALAGHYVMYSLLFLALLYIGLVQLILPKRLPVRSRPVALLATVATLSVLFCLWADYHAYRELHARQRALIAHLILWERHPDHLVLINDEDPQLQIPGWIPLKKEFQADLTREIALGLYVPPYHAWDPLPVRPHAPSTLGIEDEPTPPQPVGKK